MLVAGRRAPPRMHPLMHPPVDFPPRKVRRPGTSWYARAEASAPHLWPSESRLMSGNTLAAAPTVTACDTVRFLPSGRNCKALIGVARISEPVPNPTQTTKTRRADGDRVAERVWGALREPGDSRWKTAHNCSIADTRTQGTDRAFDMQNTVPS